jgi:hypothetical protein
MREVGRDSTYALNRIYYDDGNGGLVAKILDDDISEVIKHNQEMAADFRPHQKGETRVLAEIPVSLYYKWLVESGAEGFADEDVMNTIISKKLKDPANKYLLTVPSDYELGKF